MNFGLLCLKEFDSEFCDALEDEFYRTWHSVPTLDKDFDWAYINGGEL